jgi:hypothetical protein
MVVGMTLLTEEGARVGGKVELLEGVRVGICCSLGMVVGMTLLTEEGARVGGKVELTEGSVEATSEAYIGVIDI